MSDSENDFYDEADEMNEVLSGLYDKYKKKFGLTKLDDEEFDKYIEEKTKVEGVDMYNTPQFIAWLKDRIETGGLPFRKGEGMFDNELLETDKRRGMTLDEWREYARQATRKSREKKEKYDVPLKLAFKDSLAYQEKKRKEREAEEAEKAEKASKKASTSKSKLTAEQKEKYKKRKEEKNLLRTAEEEALHKLKNSRPYRRQQKQLKQQKLNDIVNSVNLEDFNVEDLKHFPPPLEEEEQLQLPQMDFNPHNLFGNLSGINDDNLFPAYDFGNYEEGSGMFHRQIRKMKGYGNTPSRRSNNEEEYVETQSPNPSSSRPLPQLPWSIYSDIRPEEIYDENIYSTIAGESESEDEDPFQHRELPPPIRYTPTAPPPPSVEISPIRRHHRPINEAQEIALEERHKKLKEKTRAKMDREDAEMERRRIQQDKEQRDSEDAEIARRMLGDRAKANLGKLSSKHLGRLRDKYVPENVFIPEGKGSGRRRGGKLESHKQKPLTDINEDEIPIPPRPDNRLSQRLINRVENKIERLSNVDYRDFSPYELHLYQTEVKEYRDWVLNNYDEEEISTTPLNVILYDIARRIKHRQGPRGHLPYEEEGAGIFSSIKDIGNKVVDTGKNLYEKAKHIVSTATKLNNTSRKTLEKFGNQKIKNIIATKEVVQKSVTTLINLISLGHLDKEKNKMGYDDFFHIRLYCEMENGTYILLEKNEVVFIYPKGEIKGEKLPINYKSNSLTLNELVEKTIKYMGDKDFYDYDAFTNNCASFVISILKANGLWSEKDKSFLLQDVKHLKDTLPKTKQVASFITKLGAIVSRVRGKGISGGMEYEHIANDPYALTALIPYNQPLPQPQHQAIEEDEDDDDDDEEPVNFESSEDPYYDAINNLEEKYNIDFDDAEDLIKEFYGYTDEEYERAPTTKLIKQAEYLLSGSPKSLQLITALLANKHLNTRLPSMDIQDIFRNFM